MFEVGFSELLLIMALSLIVLGPEKLPKVASQVGRWMGRARAMARQFRETLEEEVQLEPTIRRPGTASSGTASSGSSSAGAAASSPASEPVATSAAAAGGLAASATHDDPPLSNIPYSDAGYSDAGYSAASGDDADTRHNDYDGAAYTPPDASPDTSLDPLAQPPAADVSAYGDPGTAGQGSDFDPNFDPTAPIADPHGQRGA
jgi:sec-independent protein translocase protein TatB